MGGDFGILLDLAGVAGDGDAGGEEAGGDGRSGVGMWGDGPEPVVALCFGVRPVAEGVVDRGGALDLEFAQFRRLEVCGVDIPVEDTVCAALGARTVLGSGERERSFRDEELFWMTANLRISPILSRGRQDAVVTGRTD